ncbi:dihydroneopterin aldolase [Porphyromonas gingivalis JCVI SC001]|nr:dihydroneopterin aldolase [Porphyromonas gingivalis JCVI SC001]
MRFYARHGVLEQERQVGNRFVVNLSLSVDVTQAVISDAIEDTIHYGHVYEAVKEEILQPSNLIEHVAGRILQRIRHDFPQVNEVTVSLSKLNPPHWCGHTIGYDRPARVAHPLLYQGPKGKKSVTCNVRRSSRHFTSKTAMRLS